VDLSFPRFDKDARVTALPADLAVLLVGIAARQATSPTALIQQRQPGTEGDKSLFETEKGAFSAATAASIADWKRE